MSSFWLWRLQTSAERVWLDSVINDIIADVTRRHLGLLYAVNKVKTINLHSFWCEALCVFFHRLCMCYSQSHTCSSLSFRYLNRRWWSWARSSYPLSTRPPAFPGESLTWAGEYPARPPPSSHPFTNPHVSHLTSYVSRRRRKRRFLASPPPTWLPLPTGSSWQLQANLINRFQS